jgi:hypothetical protein
VRTIKLFAVIGLAVALVAVPALAARVTIQISGTAQAGDLFIQVDDRDPVRVTLTAGQAIAAVRNAIVSALNNQQAGTAEAIGNDQILINAASSIKIGEAADRLNPLPFEKDKEVKARGLTFKVVTVVVPTLTEWGLIALAVLLAGGMGYMIYRRRPALRPAAP